ncbi:NAD(P)/FAD-dependent oxidoreductase [Halobellus sp. EA9]|uniref:NAD(P)/FAD-dependent oxidoreductase n=1 Tax=Halobellus sp. EA9 TaxID=3421647 RepID=UPI003EBE7C63
MSDSAEQADGSTPRLGVVGAGAAGAAAAYALRDADVAVTVFEKSGGVCGRAATRRRDDCYYDHGANYVKEADERTAALLEELGTEGFVEIDEPVWTFDGDGTIEPGDRESTKRTWTDGITQLAKRLFDRAGTTVHRRTRIDEIRARGTDRETRWNLTDTEGSEYGPFDALLVTPPAPQTAELLRATAWDDARREELVDAVDAVPYRTIRTVVLHYPFCESYPWYGLVNPDREHAIGWLSREECKPGHVPDGESLLVVQMSPAWSTETYDDALAEIESEVCDRVADLLGEDRYRDPDWTDDQGWRYALPDSAVDAEAIRAAEDAGLYFAGDWVAGEGRVPSALWNGHETGERIGAALD